MNLVSRSLFNRDEYHSYPTNGIREWKFWGCLGQVFCMSDKPKSTDKYPSLVIPGYIYSARGKPLTVIATCWAVFRRTWHCLNSVVESFSAPFTKAPHAEQIWWIFCSYNCWDSLDHRSFTFAFADFNICSTRIIPFLWENCFTAPSSALMGTSMWF